MSVKLVEVGMCGRQRGETQCALHRNENSGERRSCAAPAVQDRVIILHAASQASLLPTFCVAQALSLGSLSASVAPDRGAYQRARPCAPCACPGCRSRRLPCLQRGAAASRCFRRRTPRPPPKGAGAPTARPPRWRSLRRPSRSWPPEASPPSSCCPAPASWRSAWPGGSWPLAAGGAGGRARWRRCALRSPRRLRCRFCASRATPPRTACTLPAARWAGRTFCSPSRLPRALRAWCW